MTFVNQISGVALHQTMPDIRLTDALVNESEHSVCPLGVDTSAFRCRRAARRCFECACCETKLCLIVDSFCEARSAVKRWLHST
jgi:hypothetical protein